MEENIPQGQEKPQAQKPEQSGRQVLMGVVVFIIGFSLLIYVIKLLIS
jgi:hypothetical protein